MKQIILFAHPSDMIYYRVAMLVYDLLGEVASVSCRKAILKYMIPSGSVSIVGYDNFDQYQNASSGKGLG